MKRRLHPLYKKLLLLAVVIGPFVWLVLTEDGQWRTDTVLLSLLGKASLNLAPERLQPGLSAADFQERFPKLELGCSDAVTAFGDHLCTAEIGTFNGIPSRYLTLFYNGERLAAVKIDYRRTYHGRLLRWLEERLGSPGSAAARVQASSATHTWVAEEGVVVARAGALAGDDEPALLWLSREAVSSSGG